jgi:hypothetical protein
LLQRKVSGMKTIRYVHAVAIASGAMCFALFAYAATGKQEDNPQVMFVQSAAGMSFRDGKPTLMSTSTIFFSGRPAKLMAGHVPCHKFIRAWSAGDDSFEKKPANASRLPLMAGERPRCPLLKTGARYPLLPDNVSQQLAAECMA